VAVAKRAVLVRFLSMNFSVQLDFYWVFNTLPVPREIKITQKLARNFCKVLSEILGFYCH
ncbi:MAG: hypothetical protein ACKPAE_02540, partial [Microcystis panniformis]